jgi:hypothetical protein
MRKTDTPLLPIIVASVVAGVISIPFHGVLQTMIVVLASIGVGAFARQRALSEQRAANRI